MSRSWPERRYGATAPHAPHVRGPVPRSTLTFRETCEVRLARQEAEVARTVGDLVVDAEKQAGRALYRARVRALGLGLGLGLGIGLSLGLGLGLRLRLGLALGLGLMLWG